MLYTYTVIQCTKLIILIIICTFDLFLSSISDVGEMSSENVTTGADSCNILKSNMNALVLGTLCITAVSCKLQLFSENWNFPCSFKGRRLEEQLTIFQQFFQYCCNLLNLFPFHFTVDVQYFVFSLYTPGILQPPRVHLDPS